MNILDPKFKYTSAAATNISKTFARERKRLAEQASLRAKLEAATAVKVTTLPITKRNP